MIKEIKRYFDIKIDNKFHLQGFENEKDKSYIEWYVYNEDYGQKVLLFGVKRDFDIVKYIKNNYDDLYDIYWQYVEE